MSEDTMTMEETMTIETPENNAPEIEQPEPLTIEDVEAMLAEQFPPAAPVEPFAGDDTATWHYCRTWTLLNVVCQQSGCGSVYATSVMHSSRSVTGV